MCFPPIWTPNFFIDKDISRIDFFFRSHSVFYSAISYTYHWLTSHQTCHSSASSTRTLPSDMTKFNHTSIICSKQNPLFQPRKFNLPVRNLPRIQGNQHPCDAFRSTSIKRLPFRPDIICRIFLFLASTIPYDLRLENVPRGLNLYCFLIPNGITRHIGNTGLKTGNDHILIGL